MMAGVRHWRSWMFFVVAFELTLTSVLGACASSTSDGKTASRAGQRPSTTVASTRGARPSARPTTTAAAPTSATTSPPATTRPASTRPRVPTSQLRMVPFTVIRGGITPKSVVASGKGVVFAQNMIYSHTITIYDQDGKLLATIPDAVDLARFGITGHPAGQVKGGPVEMAFSPDGSKAYVSNYSMYGPGFGRAGHDSCSPASGFDSSFVYRVDVARRAIDKVIPVGSVPKYVATTPDGKYVLVTNWCSYDMSVIDTATGAEVKRLPIGRYPRGIAVDSSSRTAYVAVMGGRDIVTVNLATFALGRIANVGGAPRHLVISHDDKTLFATLNSDGQVAKIDLGTGRVVAKVTTGSAPRSMAISSDGLSLYVDNYESSTVSKVDEASMKVVQTLPTNHHPIGITYDALTGRIWVCLSLRHARVVQRGVTRERPKFVVVDRYGGLS